ncbi:MAG: hypothetical protein ACE5HI_15835, partial [bacterium]
MSDNVDNAIKVTGSMLYDLISCVHRPSMDIYADVNARDEISVFVKLLWEKGLLHEQNIIDGLDIDFLDL